MKGPRRRWAAALVLATALLLAPAAASAGEEARRSGLPSSFAYISSGKVCAPAAALDFACSTLVAPGIATVLSELVIT